MPVVKRFLLAEFYRRRKGVSLRVMSAHCDVSTMTLSLIENGETVGLAVRQRAAKYLGCPVERLQEPVPDHIIPPPPSTEDVAERIRQARAHKP